MKDTSAAELLLWCGLHEYEVGQHIVVDTEIKRSTHIPEYVLKLASKRRGVYCHWSFLGTAKRQKNYFMQEAQ